jgi:hypothetical protein
MTLRETIENMLSKGAVPVVACFRCERVEAFRSFEPMIEGWAPEGEEGKFRCRCGAGLGWIMCLFSADGPGDVDAAIKALEEMAAKIHAEALERAENYVAGFKPIGGVLPDDVAPFGPGVVQIEAPVIELDPRLDRSLGYSASLDPEGLVEVLRLIPIEAGTVLRLRPDYFEQLGRPEIVEGFRSERCDDVPHGLSWILERLEQ